MVKDRCEDCNGVAPHSCSSRNSLAGASQVAVAPPNRARINMVRRGGNGLPPSRLPQPQAASGNPWGPVFQSRENFLEMHLR